MTLIQFKHPLRAAVAWLMVSLLGGFAALSAQAEGSRTMPRVVPFRTLGEQRAAFAFSPNIELEGRTFEGTLRVLAIRVDFDPDTLATTTGDGGFFLQSDAIPEEMGDWIVDPPPHDRNYFEDQLLAARRYFEKFSRNKLILTGVIDNSASSGGDVFPRVESKAYHIPYPIWHVNYGDSDDPALHEQLRERLNETLTQLFFDAWTSADTTAGTGLRDEGVSLEDYDLFVIFHAGAGNEFNLGFDTTPHDIPSVYIGPEDLGIYLDRPDGVPLGPESENQFHLMRGVILPETQRQLDVDVGMLGTVCAQLLFLAGQTPLASNDKQPYYIPHLYQPDTGSAGIGLFGLMDRGFAGFFGAIPTPPSAWMRAYLGWDPVTVWTDRNMASGDTVRLGGLHLPDSLFAADSTLQHLVKVPINRDEYYLLESRRRDPQRKDTPWKDSTFAVDRNGDTLVMRDVPYGPYDFQRRGDAFGVAIEFDDYDFGFPASGILIWHVDEGVIRAGIAEDRVQENRYHRGVSLEEADGTEDIGEEYGFLQPGDGTQNGYYADAWYDTNSFYFRSNDKEGVEFGPDTAPATTAYSGGESRLVFDGFSSIGDIMEVHVRNAWEQADYPRSLSWNPDSYISVTLADLDGDGVREPVLYDSRGRLHFLFGDTTTADNAYPRGMDREYQLARNRIFSTVAADVDADGSDELIVAAESLLVRLDYDPLTLSIDTSFSWLVSESEAVAITLCSPGIAPSVIAAYRTFDAGDSSYTCAVYAVDPSFPSSGLPETPILELQTDRVRFALMGSEETDTVAIVDDNAGLTLLYAGTGETIYVPPLTNGGQTPGSVNNLISADFDGDGTWDLAAACSNRTLVFWWGKDGLRHPETVVMEQDLWKFTAFDIDHDGIPELVGISGESPPRVIGVEPTGVITENTMIPIPSGTHYSAASPVIADFRGDGERVMLAPAVLENQDVDGINRDGVTAVGLKSRKVAGGFPLDFSSLDPDSSGHANLEITVAQLDLDDNLELIVSSAKSKDNEGSLRILNLPVDPNGSPEILWGMDGGDPRRTNHIAAPATPASSPVSAGLGRSYCWPNPVVDDMAHFRFFFSGSGTALLTVYDLMGREVARASKSFGSGAEYEIELDCRDLPSGVYVARLEVGSEYSLIRFAVVQ